MGEGARRNQVVNNSNGVAGCVNMVVEGVIF